MFEKFLSLYTTVCFISIFFHNISFYGIEDNEPLVNSQNNYFNKSR